MENRPAVWRGGLLPLRFSHAQIRWEPDYVTNMLRLALERLRAGP